MKYNPVLLSYDKWLKAEYYVRDRVKKISIVNSIEKYNSIYPTLLYDASFKQNGSIRVYSVKSGTELIIACNGSGKINVGPSMHKMFSGFTALERIEGLNILDTSNVTDMSYLFYHCTSLKELDLSFWNVSNVQNFRGTFCCGDNQIGNAKLKKLNLSGWDVSSATDMAYMFYGCGQLKHIEVSGWNTGKVKNFRHTFADCFSLKEIDVSRWNTESVITLDGIFNDCRSIKQIDISGWNTSACLEFDQLFDSCHSLKKISGLEKLNTSAGISFEEMFFGCRKLKELDLSALDTRGVDGHEFTAYDSEIHSTSNMKKLLAGCNSLRQLKTGANFANCFPNAGEHGLLKRMTECGFVIVTPETNSMRPMLRGKKDQAVFRKKDICHKNDIVLFRSDFSPNLVMHRIKRVLPQGYVIRGDNALYSEFVFKSDVYAVASEIYRNGKKILRKSAKYELLSFLSIGYDWLYLKYQKSNRPFWKAARKIKRSVFGKKNNRALSQYP